MTWIISTLVGGGLWSVLRLLATFTVGRKVQMCLCSVGVKILLLSPGRIK